MPTVFLIAVATFASTFLGGLFALKLRDKLHLILGFSAGAIVAVAFFDLLPEALTLSGGVYSAFQIMTAAGLGFMAYLAFDRFMLLHGHAGEEEEHLHARAIAGAGSLSLHSFLDGLGIGLAFHVSTAVGAVVAVAVLVHDFSDGINTVNMVLKNKGERSHALKWLLIDALAPVVGVAVALYISVSAQVLAMLLAVFAGFFLYIGASDLIPESHHGHPTGLTTYMTVLGMLALYVVIRFAA